MESCNSINDQRRPRNVADTGKIRTIMLRCRVNIRANRTQRIREIVRGAVQCGFRAEMLVPGISAVGQGLWLASLEQMLLPDDAAPPKRGLGVIEQRHATVHSFRPRSVCLVCARDLARYTQQIRTRYIGARCPHCSDEPVLVLHSPRALLRNTLAAAITRNRPSISAPQHRTCALTTEHFLTIRSHTHRTLGSKSWAIDSRKDGVRALGRDSGLVEGARAQVGEEMEAQCQLHNAAL
jgi:hypothetical protein